MTTTQNNKGKSILERVARRVMTERGFLVDFSEAALSELEKIAHADQAAESPGKDLRHLLWDRIVEIAAQHNSKLPQEPDSSALASFLAARKAADPIRFPDLSLSVIKMLGPGEYVVESPDETAPGHFGLAVRDYTHATAPNRRFPDLITHRILKATLDGAAMPYPALHAEGK